LAAGQRLHIIN